MDTEQFKQKVIKEFEENPVAWHIDTRGKWFLSKLSELEKAVREEIVKEARKRYKCGACDSKTSNLSHTMLCEFLQSLTLKQ